VAGSRHLLLAGASMPISAIPSDIQSLYEIHEWKHASAILEADFQDEWLDLIDLLSTFRLRRSSILAPGGGKSPISRFLDSYLYDRGWTEKEFQTSIIVDRQEHETPTHKVDCFRNRIALEIEWNNKDPFYDRDLNNFRLLFELQAISVGIIITRCDSLQELFVEIGKGASFGASTTHMSKLIPRIEGGGAGGCPVLVFGISRELYEEDA
jgi:restriction endonuclease BglII